MCSSTLLKPFFNPSLTLKTMSIDPPWDYCPESAFRVLNHDCKGIYWNFIGESVFRIFLSMDTLKLKRLCFATRPRNKEARHKWWFEHFIHKICPLLPPLLLPEKSAPACWRRWEREKKEMERNRLWQQWPHSSQPVVEGPFPSRATWVEGGEGHSASLPAVPCLLPEATGSVWLREMVGWLCLAKPNTSHSKGHDKV